MPRDEKQPDGSALPPRPKWVKSVWIVGGVFIAAFVVVHLLTGGGAEMFLNRAARGDECRLPFSRRRLHDA